MIHPASIRARLREGEACVGAWVMTPNVAFAEIAAGLGLNFVVFDMEHGAIDLADLPDLLRGLKGGRTAGIVRVPSHDPTFISRVLDRGAQGIIVPRVDTAEVAALVARAARFPPIGGRGLALPGIRATGHGTDPEYRARNDEEVLVAVQIESELAVENAVAIGTAPGVDVAFVGPGDLSADLGLEAVEDRGRFIPIVDDTFRQLAAAGVVTGTVPHAGRSWQELADGGVRFLVVTSDVTMMRDGLQALIAATSQHAGGAPRG